MKRWLVLSAVSLASVAGMLAGIWLAFDVQPDRFGEGILVLHAKQGSECRALGGCAIVSPREMGAIEQMIRSDERTKMHSDI